MTGYVLVYAACFGCHRMFGFNPHRVPSINVAGQRHPVCRACVDVVNPKRRANGLPEIEPHADAYEPMPESDF